MNRFYLGSLIILLVGALYGCQQNEVLSNNLHTSKAAGDFIEPEPSDWVEYTKPLREYMYFRTQAVVADDITVLWERYPDLKEGIDLEAGINTEREELESLNQGFTLLDASYNIEGHEQIKVNKLSDTEAIVLAHGGIAYLRDDFDESGGEFLIEIFLEKKEGRWTVVKTDEYTLPEYKKWIEENQ